MKNLIDDTLAFIKKIPQPILVGFSGGKDSIVIAKLVELANVTHELVYSNTTIDPPDLTRFIKKYYPHCTWTNPTRSFWKMIPASNPPTRRYRWCCTALKKRPTWKLPYSRRIMGLRSEESGSRKRLPKINFFKKLGHTHYYPILDWNECHVWEFIEEYKLPYCKLYDEGFDRLGCVVCPMRSNQQTLKYHQIWRERYPKYFLKFENACKKWWDKRIRQGRTMAYPTVEEFIEDWYWGTAVWYSKPKLEQE